MESSCIGTQQVLISRGQKKTIRFLLSFVRSSVAGLSHPEFVDLRLGELVRRSVAVDSPLFPKVDMTNAPCDFLAKDKGNKRHRPGKANDMI